MMQCGLDFQGSDDMPECKLYTLRGGQTIERKPDGRKCLTCFLRDDMWCCVQIAIHQKKAYIAWGQVDAKTGESSSTRCYCCLKHFNSVVRYSRVPSITLSEYETQLGLDGKALELHQARIVALLHDAVDKGTFNHTVNWQVNEKRAVVLQHKQAMINKKPGFQFLPTEFYIKKYGDLATNSKRAEGHRPWSIDGQQGVLIPDDPVVYIEFQ